MPFDKRVEERIPKKDDFLELKDCPFCKSKAVLNGTLIKCTNCGVEMKGTSVTIVIGKWNRRTLE